LAWLALPWRGLAWAWLGFAWLGLALLWLGWIGSAKTVLQIKAVSLIQEKLCSKSLLLRWCGKNYYLVKTSGG
jgi:hypothetical protein